MAKHLTQSLVGLSRNGLAPQSVPELRLYHAERGFHVAALVIMPHVLILISHERMVYALPCRRLSLIICVGIIPESDVRLTAFVQDELQTSRATVCLICADFM